MVKKRVSFKDQKSKNRKPNEKINKKVLNVISEVKQTKQVPMCEFCKKGSHLLPDCYAFKDASFLAKIDFAKKNKYCYHCLRKNHFAKQCMIKPGNNCDKNGCDRKHHSLLHGKLKNMFAEDIILVQEDEA